MQDVYLNGVGGKFFNGVLYRLYGAVDVSLYNNAQFPHLSLVYLLIEVFEAHPGGLRKFSFNGLALSD